MTRHEGRSRTKPIYLNEEEALALLDICLFMESDNDPSKMDAMRKVASLCREFMREGQSAESWDLGIRRPGFQAALHRLTRRREEANAYAG